MDKSDIIGNQWIEIAAGAMRHNLRLLREVMAPGTLLAAVVKANAYGHGQDQVVPIVASEADWFAVHSAEEARCIRRLGVTKPVLIMGFVQPSDFFELDGDVHLLVSSLAALPAAGEYRRATGIALPVHLKVNTGTYRQGLAPDQLPAMCQAVHREGLDVVGIATHFANIEDTLEHDFAHQQLERFRAAVAVVRSQLGGDPPFLHAACSAAALLFRETDFTMVRAGISLYGHWPSRETELSWMLEHGRDALRLQPVLSFKAVVGQVQQVPKGATVGYGRTWTALRPTTLAVVPVGYADGYPRALGNRARVLIRGVPAPVVGRVCMNIMMADVTDIPGVDIGDELVLIGRDRDARVTAEELATLSGTINYELLTRLSPAIPRFVV